MVSFLSHVVAKNDQPANEQYLKASFDTLILDMFLKNFKKPDISWNNLVDRVKSF